MSNLPVYVMLPTLCLALLAGVVGTMAFVFNVRLLMACVRGKRPSVSAELQVSIGCLSLAGVLLWVCFPCLGRFKLLGGLLIALDIIVNVLLIFGYGKYPQKVSKEQANT